MLNTTERFSDRVSNYIKYRPSYPSDLIDTLIKQCELEFNSVIADIGSGTGKLAQLLVERNLCVTGVEPNLEMRTAAEALLSKQSGFTSVDAQAEATGLTDMSIDLITVAQAFHWFDIEQTKAEFKRILKPDAHIALIWNERDTKNAFQCEYDEMLTRHAAEYSKASHRNINEAAIREFFCPRTYRKSVFAYSQKFDLTSFIGRMNSSSYTPKEGTAEFDVLLAAAEALFSKHQQSGVVEFTYQSNLFLTDPF